MIRRRPGARAAGARSASRACRACALRTSPSLDRLRGFRVVRKARRVEIQLLFERVLPAVRTGAPKRALGLEAGSVDGVSMVLTFSEALDARSVPGADAFTVRVTKNQVTTRAALAGAVAIDGNTVTLTLASPVQVDGVVGLDYAPPTGSGASPLRDAAGNEVAGMQGRSIANTTRHGPPTRLRAVPGDRVVRLIWDDPANGDPLGGYEVRRAQGAFVPENTPWFGRQDLAGTRTSVLALELRNGRSHSFEVRALDSVRVWAPGRSGILDLNVDDAIAGDNTINIAEKRDGFEIAGDTGSEAGGDGVTKRTETLCINKKLYSVALASQ